MPFSARDMRMALRLRRSPQTSGGNHITFLVHLLVFFSFECPGRVSVSRVLGWGE